MDAYATIAQGAEIDSSVVIVDKSREFLTSSQPPRLLASLPLTSLPPHLCLIPPMR